MKFLLALMLVTSCATEKKMEKKVFQTPAETAGESEARLVSPYTVRPCYCMKIFRPVCAKGQTYGNSCEAECYGHTTWKEGACEKAEKK